MYLPMRTPLQIQQQEPLMLELSLRITALGTIVILSPACAHQSRTLALASEFDFEG